MAGKLKHNSVGDELSRPEWESEDTHTLDSQAQGDVPIASGTDGLKRLPAGTEGQVLTTHGAGADPSWEDPTGGGVTSHDALTDVSDDDHHPKSHAHNGADGSGTVAGSDLTGVPGGELGNSWAAPTVDALHSGSTHANLPPGAQVNGVDILTAAYSGTMAANARVAVENAGTPVGTRRTLNYIPGTGISLGIVDDAGNEEVDITITATGAVAVADTVPGEFYIWLDGTPTAGTIKAVNLKTGATDFSGLDGEVVINAAINAVTINTDATSSSGGMVWLGSYEFVVDAPVVLNATTSGAGLWLRGSGRRRGTLVSQGVDFTTFIYGEDPDPPGAGNGDFRETISHGLIEVGVAGVYPAVGTLPNGAIVSDIGLYGNAAFAFTNSSGLLIHGSDISVDHISAFYFDDFGIFLWGENGTAGSGKCFSIHVRSCYVGFCRNAAYGTCGANSTAVGYASDLLFHDCLAEGDSQLAPGGAASVTPNMVGFQIRCGAVWLDQTHAWFCGLQGYTIAGGRNILINGISESNGSHNVYMTGYECFVIGGFWYRGDFDATETGIADVRSDGISCKIMGGNHCNLTPAVERPIWVGGDGSQAVGNYVSIGAGTEAGILWNGADDGMCATNYIGTGPTYAVAMAATADDNFVVNNYCGNGQIDDQYAGGTGDRNELFDNYATGTVTIDGAATRYRDENGNGRRVNKTAAYTAILADRWVTCTGAGAAFAITLPAAATAGDGHRIGVKRAGSTNNITVTGTIDGGANFVLDGTREAVDLLCDGSAYHIVGHYTN